MDEPERFERPGFHVCNCVNAELKLALNLLQHTRFLFLNSQLAYITSYTLYLYLYHHSIKHEIINDRDLNKLK